MEFSGGHGILMTYNLTFTKTYEGLLRVAVNSRNGCHETVAIYEDDREFLRLVRHCGISSDVVLSLERAVVVAFSPIRTPTYCDDLILTAQQLQFLRLGMANKLSA